MPRTPRVRFKTLIGRLTGFSTPFFGVSWEPPKSERDVIRQLVNFLEDRRVLFNPFMLEVEWQVVDSVAEIRGHLTEALDELGENSPGIAPVKAMRAACRRFLDEPHPDLPHIGQRWGHPDGNGFFVALGELRATFGTHLAFLAAQYGIDVEGDLASVLPAEDRG